VGKDAWTQTLLAAEPRFIYLLILKLDHWGDDDEIQLSGLILNVSEKFACQKVVVSLYPGNQPALKYVKSPAVGDEAAGKFLVKGYAIIEPVFADLCIKTFCTRDSFRGCLILSCFVDLVDCFHYRLKLFFNCR